MFAQPGNRSSTAYSVRELTAAQLYVAAAFFALPEAEGFVLVGGAALISLHLVDRFTDDLDFFTDDPIRVGVVADAFQRSAHRSGWTVRMLRESPTFRRLTVTIDTESVQIDIAVDSPQQLPSVESPAGPTLAPMELAARKLLALFDRAQPRDFVDVFSLVERFGKERVFELAGRIDRGLDRSYLVVAFRILDRIPATRLPCDPSLVPAVRAFFAEWSEELDATAG